MAVGSMFPKTSVLLLVSVGFLVSGCAAPEQPTPLPIARTYFEATYESPGLVIKMTLGPERLIRSPTLGWEPAMPLHVDVPGPFDGTYWLDEDLHLLRYDMACGLFPDPTGAAECQYHAVSWEDRGAVAPLGLGWNEHREGDVLPFTLRGQPAAIFLDVDHEGRELTLAVRNATLGFAAEWTTTLDELIYEDDARLPIRFATERDGDRVVFERTDLRRTGPIQWAFDPMPRVVPKVRDWDGLLHPGEEDSVTNDSVTVLDAVAGLKAASRNASALLTAGGCIQQYTVIEGHDVRSQPALGLRHFTYTFDVASVGGDGRKVILDRDDSPLGTDWVSPEERELDRPRNCKTDQLPDAKVAFQTFQEFLSDVPVSGDPLQHIFTTGPLKRGERWDDANQSRVRYAARFDPDWVPEGQRFRFLYGVDFDAVLGEFVLMMVSPDDVRALDADPPR